MLHHLRMFAYAFVVQVGAHAHARRGAFEGREAEACIRVSQLVSVFVSMSVRISDCAQTLPV